MSMSDLIQGILDGKATKMHGSFTSMVEGEVGFIESPSGGKSQLDGVGVHAARIANEASVSSGRSSP